MSKFKLPPPVTIEEAKTRELTNLELQSFLVGLAEHVNERNTHMVKHINQITVKVNNLPFNFQADL